MNSHPPDAPATVEPRAFGIVRSRNVSRKTGLGLKDFLIIFFRHKKKITFLTLLGLVGGAAVYFERPVVYQSQAKLLVKYVLSRNALDEYESEVGTSSGRYMKTTLDAEMQILTSWDLFTKVAEIVGPEKILPADSPVKSNAAAAAAIQRNLLVENGRDSQVITLSYSHRDGEIPSAVLTEFVRQYFVRHLAIHRPGSAVATATARRDAAKSDLTAAEEALTKLQKELGVTALQEALSSLEAQRNSAHAVLMLAEAELLAMKANVTALEHSGNGTAAAPPASEPDFATVEAYRTQMLRKESLLAEQNRILQSYTPSSERARNIRERIEEVEAARLDLLKKNPALIRTAVSTASRTGTGALSPLEDAGSQLPGMQARVDFLREEAAKLDQRLQLLTVKAPEFERLQRDKKLIEEKYTFHQREIDKALVDQSLDVSMDKSALAGGANMPNIDIIQQPSVPLVVPDKKALMLALGLPMGGLALGMGLALLIELFLDRKVKRPHEIESSLQLPLMLSIPLLKAPTSSALKARRQLGGSNGEGALALGDGDPSIAWDEDHFMRPFADAIRDRLGYYFDQNGLTHKPKLIGLTGFSDDAGTSILATSLAASFAETVGGRVLFVDLTGGHSESIGLGQPSSASVESDSTEGMNALEEQGGDFGVRKQKENLFVAKVPTRNGKTLMPRKLFELLPKFRASNFEYIIFDMPPMGTTSPTLAMAGMMDKLLLIVDAGKTSREVIRRGFQELSATRADVSTILNKTEENLPSWLQG